MIRPTQRLRMPVGFGPSPGPRQGPAGQRFDMTQAPRSTATVSFLTDASALAKLLPPCCVLEGEPIVTVEHVSLRALEWLAGRGYNLLGVKFPVRYVGPAETVRGPFMSVLWENRAEPIITGREELGFAKLYCDLPEPRILRDAWHYAASWDGHEFIRLTLSNLVDVEPPARRSYDGVLHHRFLPSLSVDGGADVDEMVLSPSGSAAPVYRRFRQGDGAITFVPSSWEQLPTMFHIVNALADLPVHRVLGATLADTRGANDLSDQRALT